MPAYSFKERFVPMILDHTKRQTIRNRRPKGFAKPGDTIYLYYGMRTKWCRKLREATCNKTQTIYITKEGNVLLFEKRIDSIPDSIADLYNEPFVMLTENECDQLAWDDGFRPEGSSIENTKGCFDIMLRWWNTTHELPFIGDIIYW